MAKKTRSTDDDQIDPADQAADQPDPHEPQPADPDAPAEAPAAPTQAEKDADKPALSKDEALQLLKAGHRLRFKGEDPSAWIAMTRHAGELAVSFAATDAEVDDLIGSGDLILAE